MTNVCSKKRVDCGKLYGVRAAELGIGNGFTLTEMLIALAIVGLLAAIAMPAYQESTRKSHRTDAKIMLSRLATLQEQYYFRTNRYTDDFADIVDGAVSGDPIDSDDGYYSIALTGDATSWTMVATAQGVQAEDVVCETFTLTSIGAKTAADSEDGNTTAECWQ